LFRRIHTADGEHRVEALAACLQAVSLLAVVVEDVLADLFNPNPAFEKSRFVREGRRTVVV
jgi:hypothetical protein